MAFNAYIKFRDIDGGSPIKGHKGEIEVLSWGWGIRQEGSPTGGGGAGKPQASDFTFMMEPGIASPPLAMAVCRGERVEGDVVFIAEDAGAARKGRSNAYLKITMSDCLISSYQTGGSGGGTPSDQVSLNFAKIEIEYADERGTRKESSCDFKFGKDS